KIEDFKMIRRCFRIVDRTSSDESAAQISSFATLLLKRNIKIRLFETILFMFDLQCFQKGMNASFDAHDIYIVFFQFHFLADEQLDRNGENRFQKRKNSPGN